MGELELLVSRIRLHYLEQLRAAIKVAGVEQRAGVAEVLLELGGGSTPAPYSLYRVDFVSGEPSRPSFVEFNTDSYLRFDPIEFSVRGLPCVLCPLYWNAIEFRVSGLPSNWSAIEQWIRRAIDEHDELGVDAEGLAGVIHNATKPTLDDESWQTSLDFGSAPTEYLWDFLDLLRQLGCRRVEMGSFSMIDQQPEGCAPPTSGEAVP